MRVALLGSKVIKGVLLDIKVDQYIEICLRSQRGEVWQSLISQ